MVDSFILQIQGGNSKWEDIHRTHNPRASGQFVCDGVRCTPRCTFHATNGSLSLDKETKENSFYRLKGPSS